MKYKKEFRVNLEEVGFWDKNSLASRSLATMYSASLIASLICDSYGRERFHDGAFGYDVENGLYLTMLLRLEDLIRYYEHIERERMYAAFLERYKRRYGTDFGVE